MNKAKKYFSEYFKKSALHLGKSKFIFFIFTSIELIELTIYLIDKSAILFHYNHHFNYKLSKLSSIILKISPYHHFFEFIKEKNDDTLNAILLVVIVILYLLFFIYFLNANKQQNYDEDEEIEGKGKKIYLEKIAINFFDFILFRLLTLYSLDIIVHHIIINCSKSSSSALDYILLFLYLLFISIILSFHIVYYITICSWSNFKSIDSCLKYYPYDEFFSSKYEIIAFLIKLFITINQNYMLANNDFVDFISIFTSFIILLLFLSFCAYIVIILLFSSSILYFNLAFFNKLRIFYIMLMIECIFFRIILHNHEDYVPFLIYVIILIILNCYILVEGFEPFILARVISDQNYLGICWFIQGNNIDIQHFTAEWITYHKTQCIETNCLICNEMGIEGDGFFTDFCSNENRNTISKNILRQNSLNNKKFEKKKTS